MEFDHDMLCTNINSLVYSYIAKGYDRAAEVPPD